MTFSKRCLFPASLFHHSFQKKEDAGHAESVTVLWIWTVGGAVEAVAASVWTWGGIKYSFLLTGGKGGRRVRGRCCLMAEGEHEKMVWTRAGLGWAGGVRHDMEVWSGSGGLQTASLLEGWRPVDSSPRLCLYLWVTWLLRRPGNVCSVSVLNEPPGRDRKSYHLHTVSLQSHWYMEEVSALTAALDNESVCYCLSWRLP